MGPTGRRPVVLASASPARLRLLRSAGLDPLVVVSDVDEAEVIREQVEPLPILIAAMLARAKAVAVRQAIANQPRYLNALIVGCDSVLEWAGQAWGKPATAEQATLRWQAMRGTTGILHTGHCAIDSATGELREETGSTQVKFASIGDAEIAAYVATREPLHVAGAFTLDGLGAPYIEGIIGDPSNVIGLSLPLFRRLLLDLGVPWQTLRVD